jgi:putative ABC transport system ATP-binding protein
MLKLTNLSKQYRSGSINTMAIDKINLEIKQGEFIAIMGPSGCGKSTLLNIIGLLDQATQGGYQFLNQETQHLAEKQLSQLRKENIGFIFQNFNLIDELNVEENIELALLYQKMSKRERRAKINEVMDKVGIAHRAKHLPVELSGGQQQRVAVARAIVGNQKLILADEPTGNLDSAHGQEVMDILQGINEEGTTVVMVTHSPAHAAFANRTINLYDGHVVTQSIKAMA